MIKGCTGKVCFTTNFPQSLHGKAVYDYTRNQGIAHRESERAAVANKRLLVSLLVILMITLLTSWLYIVRKELIINLEKTVAELGQIEAESVELRQDMSANQQQIEENEKRMYSQVLYQQGQQVFNFHLP